MKIENPQQYIGKKYGHTTIIKYYGKYTDGRLDFICKCDCGSEFHAIMREKDKIRTACYNCNTATIFVNYYGKRYSINALAEKLNISYRALFGRIVTYKWNEDRWAEPMRKWGENNEI